MSGHTPWQRTRAEHLSTPEARERYAKARRELEAELAADCTATSWPFTVNDSPCVQRDGHEGPHRDADGFEWGGEP